jgi:hypothetical protein
MYAERVTSVVILSWVMLIAADAREPIPIWFPPPEITVTRSLGTLERLAHIGSDDPGVYFELSILYAQRGRWEQTQKVSFRLRQLEPNNVNGYLGEAYAWVHLRNPHKALAVCEEGIRRLRNKQHLAWLYRTKGDVLLHLFDRRNSARFLNQGEQAYRQALQLYKNTALAWVGLARVSSWRKQWKATDQFARESLRVARTARERALGYYFLGKAAQLRKDSKAEEWFKKALREHPKSFQIMRR